MSTETNFPVAILGAGTFGTAIANIAARNKEVLLYARNQELAEQINTTRQHAGVVLSSKIEACSSLEEIADRCRLIFPIIPSSGFRSVMRQLGPHLRPYHMMIHGTKGFDYGKDLLLNKTLRRQDIHTMSDTILQETVVTRVGCLSGPNLAAEIMQGQPTATVIASHYKEVLEAGKDVLSGPAFHVFHTDDLLGAELAGALKNIIAIGSGILRGKGFGKNLQAVLITRGWMEMINFGKALGASTTAFMGSAGIGDLIATATSKRSRNFTFGFKLAKGNSLEELNNTMPELAEGVRTLEVAYFLARSLKLRAPITHALYKVVYENADIDATIRYLIEFPYDVDVDFL